MLHRTIVSAIVISTDNKVLFGKKDPKRGGVYMDKWHIPGGGIEKDETQLDALKREIREETNIDITNARIEPFDSIGKMITPKKLPDGEIVPCEMEFYVYKVVLDQKADEVVATPGDDFAQLKWIPIPDIKQYPQTPPSLSLFLRMGWLTADEALKQRDFRNANLEPVAYDGSEITWRVSVYVLIIQDGKLLVARSKHEKNYDVIGGGIDLGETIEDALTREALEEGGVRIKLGKLLFTAVDWFYHRKGKFYQTLQLYYQANIVGEVGKASDPDIEETAFVPIEKIGKSVQLAASPTVVASIQEYLSSFWPYKGTIVEESLLDNRMLNDFKITGFRVTNDENPSARWHLYFVEADKDIIQKLAHTLKPEKWYAHFWSGDNIIAVFPGKTFSFKHSQPQTWKKAVEYGKKLGIPAEQLDFKIEE